MNGLPISVCLFFLFFVCFALVDQIRITGELRTEAIELGFAQHNPKNGIFEWKTNSVVNVEKKN